METSLCLISKRHKWTLTSLAVFCYFSYGLSNSLLGQTAIDFKNIGDLNSTQIADLFTIRSIFYCIGSLLFGWIYGIVNRQKLFAANLILMAISIFVMPFLPHLLFLLANQAVFGLTTAGIDTASNVLIMELWETQSNRYLQTMHLGYSVGATISPLLARPFVFADDIKNNATIISNSSSVLIPASDLKIIIPFAIAAAISALAGIVFLCAEMLNPYKSPQRSITRKNQLTEKIEAGEESSDEQQLLSNQLLPMSYYYIFVTCAALLFCIYLGIECNIGNFLPMYLRQLKLEITEKTALYISATFNAMYIVMRIISIILAFKLNTAVMLSFSFALLLASNIHMFLSSSTSVLSIWIHIGFIGASCAWVYPGFYAFVEERIDVTNPIGGLFTFSSSVITSVAPLVVGNFIDNNPQVFVFWNLASIICVSILFLALLGTDVWKKKALTRLTVYRIAQ